MRRTTPETRQRIARLKESDIDWNIFTKGVDLFVALLEGKTVEIEGRLMRLVEDTDDAT